MSRGAPSPGWAGGRSVADSLLSNDPPLRSSVMTELPQATSRRELRERERAAELLAQPPAAGSSTTAPAARRSAEKARPCAPARVLRGPPQAADRGPAPSVRALLSLAAMMFAGAIVVGMSLPANAFYPTRRTARTAAGLPRRARPASRSRSPATRRSTSARATRSRCCRGPRCSRRSTTTARRSAAPVPARSAGRSPIRSISARDSVRVSRRAAAARPITRASTWSPVTRPRSSRRRPAWSPTRDAGTNCRYGSATATWS